MMDEKICFLKAVTAVIIYYRDESAGPSGIEVVEGDGDRA